MSNPLQTVAISATFTAEPIKASLEFWAKRLEQSWQIQFADFNQVLQTILNPSSVFGQNRAGLNVLLLRPQDLAQFDGSAEQEQAKALEEVGVTLRNTLQAGRLAAPVLAILCPPASEQVMAPFRQACQGPSGMGVQGLHVLTAEQVLAKYPVEGLFDVQAEQMGRIPYTAGFFAALGTSVARHFDALTRPPVKLIAVDADDTLWEGICGEEAVRITPERRRFHEMLAEQRAAGVLVALASKNNPADVEQAFAEHAELPFRLEQFVSRKVNWQPKGENLLQLAEELSLGADSFLFFDDNPKEIAEMEEVAPEVLGLTIPHPATVLPVWLEHLWCLDHPVVTEADRARAQSYESQQQFQQEAHASANLSHFYATLQLQVSVESVTEETLERAAQLTQRTNQFNCSTRRRNVAELQQLQAEGMELYTVAVSDRFGDYGITGLVALRPEASRLAVDTLLLSCRVLGRGVEHAVARWLGERAGGMEVEIAFAHTAKNAPAAEFLRSLAPEAVPDVANRQRVEIRIPASYLREAAYRPTSVSPGLSEGGSRKSGTGQATGAAEGASGTAKRFRGYGEIAEQLRTVPQILHAMREAAEAGSSRPLTAPPVTETEQALAAIWRELLGQSVINTTDNFFDLGGHSLTAVLLVSNIRERFGVGLSMDDVYSANLTLEKLARLIEAQALAALDEAEVDALLAEIEGLSDEEVAALLAEDEKAEEKQP